jgi:hypothetical protein
VAVITRFHNWQTSDLDWSAAPYDRCAPNLGVIEAWLLEQHGGLRLGCHGDRPIIGGQRPSTHAFGGAVDWRYAPSNPAEPGRWPGRDYTLAVIIPWLIAHSAELGVQAIHDYAGRRIWRPPGTSGRPADSDGWKLQPYGTQMGQPWALWLHLEIHPESWNDTRPIADRIPAGTPEVIVPVPPSPAPPPPASPHPPGGTSTVQVTVQTVRRGSTGGWVKKAQAILAANFSQDVGPIDGAFGPRTEDGIRNVQRFFGLTVDGICGPKTWNILLAVAP